jgi:predicted transcriptional regulator
MELTCIEHGDLHKREMAALELEIRNEILDFIGLEQRNNEEMKEKLGITSIELEDHLFVLEKALLVEREEDGFRLTPRCIAYIDTRRGYEWKR